MQVYLGSRLEGVLATQESIRWVFFLGEGGKGISINSCSLFCHRVRRWMAEYVNTSINEFLNLLIEECPKLSTVYSLTNNQDAVS